MNATQRREVRILSSRLKDSAVNSSLDVYDTIVFACICSLLSCIRMILYLYIIMLVSRISFLHYENIPIQIYWKFYHQKMKIFRWKILIFFYVLSRNKKNNVYPCKPQFYYRKVGFKGVKII